MPQDSSSATKQGSSRKGGPHDARELLIRYRPDLAEILASRNEPNYRHEQVLAHLFSRSSPSFSQSTVLPAALREELVDRGSSLLSVKATTTGDDRTTKLLLSARDGASIEMVVMRYQRRVTACISTQVGCPVGCAFCATGQTGLLRNLSAAEIVDQVRIAAALGEDEGWRLSNLVYMGMGEPLLNLQAVLDSIAIVTDHRSLGLGHRSISVSTVGIPAGIRRLAQAEPQVNLALSLHAADDRTRARLIPDRFRHPLVDVLTSAWDHFEMTHRKLLVEYVLLEGVNDSTGDAKRLASLLKGHVVTVNLLSWNRVGAPSRPRPSRDKPSASAAGRRRAADDVFSRFKAASPQAVVAFRETLAAAGIEAVVRQSKGAGIDAACGQLAGRSR